MASAPIADLSYRDYDGPLAPPTYRWWVIAKTTFRNSIRRKGLWWLLLFSGMYYFVMLAILFFVDQFAANARDGEQMFNAFIGRITWKTEFLHGWSTAQMWFLLITLLIGAGAIANDNRANALLVYLSKPCDKRDYLMGKWVGLFLTLLLLMSIPIALFFAYAGLSYSEYGFFSQDRTVILRLLVMMPLGAAFYASLMIGVSSLFNQGRMAGAAMAAVYFLTAFFTKLMEGAWTVMQVDEGARRDLSPIKNLVANLYYASIDGLQIGMAKGVLGTDGSPPFGIQPRRGEGMQFVPAPDLATVLAIMAAISALALWVAWKRIRAVEVVK